MTQNFLGGLIYIWMFNGSNTAEYKPKNYRLCSASSWLMCNNDSPAILFKTIMGSNRFLTVACNIKLITNLCLVNNWSLRMLMLYSNCIFQATFLQTDRMKPFLSAIMHFTAHVKMKEIYSSPHNKLQLLQLGGLWRKYMVSIFYLIGFCQTFTLKINLFLLKFKRAWI